MPDNTRRSSWLPLLLAILAVPAIVAGVATWVEHKGIEDTLAPMAQQALADKGFPGAKVDFNGVDATIEGVPSDQASEASAKSAVEGIHGVGDARFSGTAGTPPALPSPPAPEAKPLQANISGNTITLTGTVGDEATKGLIVKGVTDRAAGKQVVDQLTVTPGAPLPNGVTLTGTAASEQEKAGMRQQVEQAVPGVKVDNQLTVAGGGGTGKNALQQQINALLAGAPIAFQPNSPQLTPAGTQTVNRVADLLRGGAQDAKVEVQGHVARTPGNDIDPQALSDQRAQTVQAQLVQAGIGADRITARGFGDTKPVESNNPAANRRVEIVVA
ncbi:peptidoglycan-binding protein ArfA [Herbihabitans rhizosphaerae]|uniref:Peptidoglycan-binding protein ArfA n=1 Tax=Herbihabitans rhizosphaerae TaxID=1872711 RepID=A0A4Q7KWV0_9PSEU|nr:OmpA family protein [Herbihabitans rhizosphaerae]RZS40760.1 peptidoglycan-binding protein ArfA [Herbihabitans rhizosphaerae]